MRVRGLDHIVLDVVDVRRSLDFYIGEVGCVIDLFAVDRTGENMNHLCLVVDDDVEALAASGRFEILQGPVPRWGARGEGLSIYLRDPDGNLVELRNYP